MANRYFKQGSYFLESEIVKLYGKVTTTTSGTIGTSSAKGFSVTKTAAETGRYTITLADQYPEFKHCAIVVEGAADAAYTSAKGLVAFIRNVSMSTKTFNVQFCDADGSPADAELEDGAKFYLEITLKNTTIPF